MMTSVLRKIVFISSVLLILLYPVIAENIALSKTAWATTEYSAGYAASYAVDGNNDTQWASVASPTFPQNITVDLGGLSSFTSIKLYQANDASVRTTTYELLISDDNITYTQIKSNTTITYGGSKSNFADYAYSGTARYVRVAVWAGATYVGIGEFQVDNTTVSSSSQNQSLTLKSTIPTGIVYAVNISPDGNWLYIGNGLQFAIWNVANPEVPTLSGVVNLSDDITSIASNGTIAYVATQTNLNAIDVSNNITPTVLGNWTPIYHDAYHTSAHFNSGKGHDIYIKNASTIYLTGYTYGFSVLDVANASNITETFWNGNESESVTGFTQNGSNYAIVGGNINVDLFNMTGTPVYITNWNNHSQAGTTTTGHTDTTRSQMYGVKVNGKYAYVTEYGWGVHVLDILNVSNPTGVNYSGYIDGVGPGEEAWGIQIKNNTAYVGWWYSGLNMLNITDPLTNFSRWTASVTSLGTSPDDNEGYNYHNTLYGNWVWNAGHYKGVAAYNISLMRNEQLKTLYNPRSGRSFGVIQNGSYMYALEDGFLKTYEMSNKSSPYLSSTVNHGGRSGAAIIRNRYLYAAGGFTSGKVYDISGSNASTPYFINNFGQTEPGEVGTRVTGLEIFYNGYYMVTLHDSTLEYWDIDTTPSIPIWKYSKNYTGLDRGGLLVDGNITYITTTDMSTWGQLIVLNTSTLPSSLTEVANVSIPQYAYDTHIIKNGNYLYTKSDGNTKVGVVNISNISAPYQEANATNTVVDTLGKITINGSTFLAVGNDNDIDFYNLSANQTGLTVVESYNVAKPEQIYQGTNFYIISRGYTGSGIWIYQNVSGAYEISGNVTSSGAPLSWVTVTVNSTSDNTDTSGIYNITGLNNGTHNISFVKMGYVTAYQNVTISGNDNHSVDVSLTASGGAATFIPPTPINPANTTGNFWVNHTWVAGTGNVTDSYNISVNGVWTNGSANTYSNDSVGIYSNIVVRSFNTSGSGSLDIETFNKSINQSLFDHTWVGITWYGQTVTIPVGMRNIYNVSFYGNLSGVSTPTMRIWDSPTKAILYGETTIAADNLEKWNNYTFNPLIAVNPNQSYFIEFNSYYTFFNDSDAYPGGIQYAQGTPQPYKDTTITVHNSSILTMNTTTLTNYTPLAPINIANTNGRYWVNHTWSPGTGNTTDSYNVSVNGAWTNGSALNYKNTSSSPSAWKNITVQSFNSSGVGTLNNTALSQNVQTLANTQAPEINVSVVIT